MKISIITTTHNRKDLLTQTIESVQKSFCEPLDIEWEHIIYDNGSTDDTYSLFENHVWKNIIYIQGQENKGPSYGRNRAIEKASGTYIFLIDSDDIILQRTLHNFAEAGLMHPKSDWFTCDFLRVDEKLSYRIGNDYYSWKFKNASEILRAIMRGEHFIQSNVFFTKEIFQRIGGFDESLWAAEDLDLFIRFLLIDCVPTSCNFISHLHRMHDSNLSNGITLDVHKAHLKKLTEKYKDRLVLKNISA